MTTEADVVAAAIAWWRTKKPVAWTHDQHLESHWINCLQFGEKELAQAVAAHLKEAGE